jgi:hypothetical protein
LFSRASEPRRWPHDPHHHHAGRLCGDRRRLAFGTVAVEPERAQDGSVHIWLDPGVLAKLKALRGPRESYSDVILQLAKGDGAR